MPSTTTFLGAAAAAAAALAAPAAATSHMTAMSTMDLDGSLVKQGTLNLTTGVYEQVHDLTIALPDDAGCHWAPLVGTEGVGTATFHTNRSYFFLAQQRCGTAVSSRVNQTLLVSTRVSMYMVNGEPLFNSSAPIDAVLARQDLEGPRTPHPEAGPEGNASIVHSFPGDVYDFPLSSWNIAWDHTCNYVVIAPRRAGQPLHGAGGHSSNNKALAAGADAEVVYETFMISEYDGQSRPQKDLARQPQHPHVGGWVKVNGLGPMDTYSAGVGGPYELNCGDNCSLYTLDEPVVAPGQPAPTAMASRIIGRNFHTAEVLSNVSNSLGVRTLVAPSDPWYNAPFVMVGLGSCCSEAGCDDSEVCRDTVPGTLALVAYGGAGPGRMPLTPLVTVGNGYLSEYNDTLRLGVVLTMGQMGAAPAATTTGNDFQPMNAYVYVDNTVQTYTLTWSNDTVPILEARHTATSAPMTRPAPDAWTIGPFSWN